MKRAASVFVAVVFGLTVARGSAQTQSPTPSVEQILDKFVAALGGRDAVEKLTSRVSKGTVEIPDAGISGTITVNEKAPDKSLAVVNLQGMGEIQDGSDGTAAWETNDQGVRMIEGAELADALRGATFNSELKLKSLYKTLVVTGKESLNGHDAYAVLATPAEGAPNRMFFDVESGLLVRQSTTRDSPQGPVDVDILMEDYRAVDGVKEPFTVRQVTSTFTIVIHLSEIKHNVAIDDALFKRPGHARD